MRKMNKPRVSNLMAALYAAMAGVASMTTYPANAQPGSSVEGKASACPKTELKPADVSNAAQKPTPAPEFTLATTVAPGDVSTSTVIRPDPSDQITCGKTLLTIIQDVVYGSVKGADGRSMDLLMDIQMPTVPHPRPLVIYVPAGGFVFAPKGAGLDLRTYVAEAGFVVASIQYRTVVNGAHYRDGIADVKAAIRFLRAHAGQYGVDKKHVAVWGESAGGYLAAMVGLTNGTRLFEARGNLEESSDVQAVIDKFGPSDISRVTADFDARAQAAFAAPNPLKAYMGADISTKANPLTYVSATSPPFLIFHGSDDRLVSPSQTLALHNALLAAGGASSRYVLEGAGHGDFPSPHDPDPGRPWSTKQTMGIIVTHLNRWFGSGD